MVDSNVSVKQAASIFGVEYFLILFPEDETAGKKTLEI
jgi:hypothetical protein